MAEPSRYDVSEDESGEVLKNKFKIGDQKILDDLETVLFKDAYTHFFELFENAELTFNSKLIFDIHRYFLSTLYEWAGRIRKVELSKGGIMFCPHSQIEKQLKIFEKILKKNLPSAHDGKKTASLKLALYFIVNLTPFTPSEKAMAEQSVYSSIWLQQMQGQEL